MSVARERLIQTIRSLIEHVEFGDMYYAGCIRTLCVWCGGEQEHRTSCERQAAMRVLFDEDPLMLVPTRASLKVCGPRKANGKASRVGPLHAARVDEYRHKETICGISQRLDGMRLGGTNKEWDARSRHACADCVRVAIAEVEAEIAEGGGDAE